MTNIALHIECRFNKTHSSGVTFWGFCRLDSNVFPICYLLLSDSNILWRRQQYRNSLPENVLRVLFISANRDLKISKDSYQVLYCHCVRIDNIMLHVTPNIHKGESPLAENVAAKSRNPFYFLLQRNFPLLDLSLLLKCRPLRHFPPSGD